MSSSSRSHSPSPNSETVYKFSKPSGQYVLPSTTRREEDGIEVLRVPQGTSEVFGRESRHFGMMIRPSAASTVNLDPATTSKIVTALRTACEEDPTLVHGIPIPAANQAFRLTRPTDLFLGSEKTVLEPGLYKVGSPIVGGEMHGKVFLEITPIAENGKAGAIFSAAVGIFHESHTPAGVDWRSAE